MKSLLLILSFAIILFASCGKRVVKGNGNLVSEGRNVSAFTMIDISAPLTATIHVQNGVAPSVQLSGYKSLLDEIETTTEGNTLKIKSKDFINFDTDKDVQAVITVASLNDLGIHGAADATVDGIVNGTNFKLKISGAGDVTIERIEVSNLVATISGAGDVKINSGISDKAQFTISGTGNINSYAMQCNDVVAKVSGAGDMQVTAIKSLEAKVSGAGSIHYKGTPALKSETSGIGEIAAAN